jgi:hypothetical protein
MRTNSDITVYNKYIDSPTRSEKYQRAEIRDVAWESRKAANVRATGGQMFADQATVYIPQQRGANYLLPVTWQALAVKTGKWTLQIGDVIVRGIVTDAINDNFTMTALKAKYDSVLVISSVDTMDGGSADMHHWQIGAK